MLSLPKILIALMFIPVAAACGETGTTDPTVTTSIDEATEAERRLRIGKGDSAGSCTDSCGEQSANGTCWCDDLCDKYGDCCDDRAAICDADEPCFVAGCSGQLCTEDPNVVTICVFKPEYACYGEHGTCARQADGGCGWGDSPALAACLEDPIPACPAVLCAAECPNGVALDANGCSTCECIPDAPAGDSCVGACGGPSSDGSCYCDDQCEGFGDCCDDRVATCELVACPPVAEPNPEACNGTQQPIVAANGCVVGFECILEPAGDCFVGGCSGQLCSDQEGLISTCEFQPEYACYKPENTTCARQANGNCGWNQTDALLTCVEDMGNPCPVADCSLVLCPSGFATDANGCQTCECAPSPSACADHCGGKAAEGCWCDTLCDGYGDCCPGKADVCE